jgi:uncharacterized protein (DUF1499 family)
MVKARWPAIVAIVTLAAALMVLIAGPAISNGWLGWKPALAGFALGALLCGIGVLTLLVAVLKRHRSRLALLALVAGIAGAGWPASLILGAGGAPAIHDITTDIDNPPAFVAITPALRGADSNPVSYDPAIAPQQAAAFPQVRPMVLAVAPAVAFFRAEKAARAMGWEIVEANQADGRIEATATVPWWGFKDDVVIRLVAEGEGTRVDVRSKSRVGQGDLGVNAKRILAYLDRLARG